MFNSENFLIYSIYTALKLAQPNRNIGICNYGQLVERVKIIIWTHSYVIPMFSLSTSIYLCQICQSLECVQRGGEMLFVPAGWSHAVINMDECIGLAVEFDTGDC